MSSPASLSIHACSHSVGLRTPSHSSTSKLDPLPSPSLYVTFKVLHLVNTFRRRVRTRVNCGQALKKKASTTRRTSDFCQEFEKQAFAEIDQYLGRKSNVQTRKRQGPSDWNDLASPQAKRETVATVAESHPQNIQWLLDELDQSVKSDNNPLVTVAKHHDLFIDRRKDFSIKHLSLKELIQQLVTVRDLLGTLRRAVSTGAHVKTLAEGNELLDLTLDESQTANLEHLLLCLRDQLLRLLVSKLVTLVRKDLVECQRDRHRHCEEWFFEFPDARHPLSTTWPWSIRPSLAVIWGVCWMFYDHNRADETPNWTFDEEIFNVTAEDIQSMLQHAQPAQQHFQGHPGPAAFGQLGDPRSPRQMANSHSLPQMRRGLSVAAASQGGQHANQYTYSIAPDLQAAHATGGLAGAHTSNAFTSAAPPLHEAPAIAGFSPHWPVSLPQENPYAPHALPYSNSTSGADDVGQWISSLAPHPTSDTYAAASWSYSQRNLPPHSRAAAAVTPQIRLITDSDAYPALHQQPQDLYHSAGAVSSASSLHNPDPFSNPNYGHPHLSPQVQRNHYMNSTNGSMERTPPHSPHPDSPNMAAIIGDQLSRKRSHEQMVDGNSTEVEQHHMHSRTSSLSQHPEQSAGEGYGSPKVTTIKRENPPTNENGKYVCDHGPDCSHHIFDRKCEWSKHMDKHDRPYRCQHSECAKLQGFTYSGGLLRHEREVHNKHGGPKAALMCPHDDCKRHTGKGFTRKENLNEHLRRVHHGKSPQSQGVSQLDVSNTMTQNADETETPYYPPPPADDDVDSPLHKRRRYAQASERSGSEVETVEDQLRLENEYLRKENERLRRDLEATQAMVVAQSSAPVA